MAGASAHLLGPTVHGSYRRHLLHDSTSQLPKSSLLPATSAAPSRMFAVLEPTVANVCRSNFDDCTSHILMCSQCNSRVYLERLPDRTLTIPNQYIASGNGRPSLNI